MSLGSAVIREAGPDATPEVVPKIVPGVVPKIVPEFVPEFVPEVSPYLQQPLRTLDEAKYDHDTALLDLVAADTPIKSKA